MGELRETIRSNLERYISASGYTQKEIAEKLGVSKSSITNWVKGKNSPDVELVVPICKLLNITIREFYGEPDEIQKLPSLSTGEQAHIKKYRLLDPYGKEAVDGVLDVESRRCEAARAAAIKEQRQQMEAGEMIDFETVIRFSVPGYSMPLSAGTGQEAGQEYPENYTLVKEPPRGTSYIAPVSGDSMEPTYHNEDIVFVHSCEEIPVGRIGVFLMDGKQWIKELGDGELISHNPEYDPIPMREDIRCQGLVLGVCDESYFE